MDLSYHIQRSNSLKAKNKYSVTDRKCISCGKELENKGSHLYFQKFCCLECKENYCGMVLEQ